MAIQPLPAADCLLTGSVEHSISCKVARFGDENVWHVSCQSFAHESREVAAVGLVLLGGVVDRHGLVSLGAVHNHDLRAGGLLGLSLWKALATGLVVAASVGFPGHAADWVASPMTFFSAGCAMGLFLAFFDALLGPANFLPSLTPWSRLAVTVRTFAASMTALAMSSSSAMSSAPSGINSRLSSSRSLPSSCGSSSSCPGGGRLQACRAGRRPSPSCTSCWADLSWNCPGLACPCPCLCACPVCRLDHSAVAAPGRGCCPCRTRKVTGGTGRWSAN